MDRPMWQFMGLWLSMCLVATIPLSLLSGAPEPLVGNLFALVIFVPFCWLMERL